MNPPSDSAAKPIATDSRFRAMAKRWFKDPGVERILRSPIFWAVLVLKVVIGSLLGSTYARDLFIPFLNYAVRPGFANPYEHFSAIGNPQAFPYPPLMLFIMAVPRLLLSPFLSSDSVSFGHLFALRLPLLVMDFGALLVLARWFPNRPRHVLLLYWCSPLVAYITYWHGQLDIVPTALFLVSMHLARNRHFAWSMLFYGLAMGTKFHLIVVLPFVLIYMAQEIGYVRTARNFGVFALTFLLILAPFIGGPGFRQMVFGTEESLRLFAFQAPIGGGLSIMIAPLAIMLLLFRFQAYPKRNWDLFVLYLGMAFSAFVILSPPRPAYILWSLPFFFGILFKLNNRALAAYASCLFFYFVFFWSSPQSDFFDAWRLVSPSFADLQGKYQLGYGSRMLAPANITNLSFTMLQASIGGLILSIYVFGVRSNSVYRMRTTASMIGLAGDSGTGKDESAHLLTLLLGERKLSIIAGDDYHKWPRGHEMWKVYSHLDVRGNNLHAQMEHALALSSGSTVYKVHYDHKTGQFTDQQPIDPNNYVLFQGLHSLSILQLRGLFDLCIFLDPDEDLRRFWKVKRDVSARGYKPEQVLEAIEARAQDRERYILPQREGADIVVTWRHLQPVSLDRLDENPELELVIQAVNSLNLGPFVSAVEEMGVTVAEFEPFVNSRWQSLRLQGTVDGASLQKLAREIVPSLEDLTADPEFVDGLSGCLQMIYLIGISTKLRHTLVGTEN